MTKLFTRTNDNEMHNSAIMPITNYSWGEPLDKVNCEDETVEVDC